MSPNVERYLKQYEVARPVLPGHGIPWLAELRDEALGRFRDVGFPTTRDEAWKHTRVTAIENRDFKAAHNGASQIEPAWLASRTFEALRPHVLLFVNGRFAAELSRTGSLPDGVKIGSLAELLETDPDLLQPHLGKHADSGQHGFAALNTALMTDGACVLVPKGVVVEQPIQVLFVSGTEDNTASHVRNLYVVGDGAEATIIETYLGWDDATYLTNTVTEKVLGRNATLNYYKVQQESLKAFHIADLHVHQARDSRLEAHSFSLGSMLARHGVNALLAEQGVSCTLSGLYLADGRRHVDTCLFVDHAKPHGTSRETFKGVVGGRARGVFNGKVLVRQDAQQTDAHMGNKNLLLSRDAEVDARPQLEIYADDVKCTHGATVGQIDEAALFYLRSRAIDEQTARGFLIFGFAHDIIDGISNASVREALAGTIFDYLPNHEQLRGLL